MTETGTIVCDRTRPLRAGAADAQAKPKLIKEDLRMDMILYLTAGGGILLYGTAYGLFCVKKGGIAAALSVFGLLLSDLALLILLLFFRTRT